MRPHVILLVFDTARADAFEPYGAPAGSTPTASQLSRSGRAVPYAVSPSNWTMPSHASMFAGALPRALGLAGAPGGKPANCKPVMQGLHNRLLPEVLRRNGYWTGGVSCNAWISPETGFDTGFDRFEAVISERTAKLARPGWKPRLRWLLEGLRADVDDGAAAAEHLIDTWIGEERNRPFFLFVNLVECHSPYLPPKPYNDLGLVQRALAVDEARTHGTMPEIWRECLTGSTIPDATLRRMRYLYDRSVTLMDDWVARLLEQLERRALLDDTLLILTSDHGENFGEGRLVGHAFSLDQRLTHVPLIVSGPNAFPAEDVVSLASLPQWVAASIGLDDHPWHEEAVPPRTGVSQYKGPATREDERTRKIVADWNLGEDAITLLTESATSATDGRWKVVRHGTTERVYDLAADPLEVAPVTEPDATSAVVALRALVDRTHQGPAPLEQPSGPTASAAEIAQLEDRLRELGYM